MVKDRLGEIKKDHVEVQIEEKPQKKAKKDREKPSSVEAGQSAALNEFFNEIGELRDMVANVKVSIDKVDGMHQSALNVISEQESKEKAHELEELISRTNKQTNEIRNKIKAMDVTNKTLAKDPANANDVRIRISQHGALTKRFLDVMMEYKDIQKKYQDRYKQRMQRQYLIVKPNATPKEIQEVIENKSENGNAQIFAKQVVNSGQKTEAKRALQDIQDRHTDIIKLEKSIMELNQLFMDMSVLVAAQGELLNQIDSHVESAVDNTNQAADEMKNAVTIQRASRKKIMIIIGIGFCAVVGGGICLYVFA